jgi:hypothetical protein
MNTVEMFHCLTSSPIPHPSALLSDVAGLTFGKDVIVEF